MQVARAPVYNVPGEDNTFVAVVKDFYIAPRYMQEYLSRTFTVHKIPPQFVSAQIVKTYPTVPRQGVYYIVVPPSYAQQLPDAEFDISFTSVVLSSGRAVLPKAAVFTILPTAETALVAYHAGQRIPLPDIFTTQTTPALPSLYRNIPRNKDFEIVITRIYGSSQQDVLTSWFNSSAEISRMRSDDNKFYSIVLHPLNIGPLREAAIIAAVILKDPNLIQDVSLSLGQMYGTKNRTVAQEIEESFGRQYESPERLIQYLTSLEWKLFLDSFSALYIQSMIGDDAFSVRSSCLEVENLSDCLSSIAFEADARSHPSLSILPIAFEADKKPKKRQ